MATENIPMESASMLKIAADHGFALLMHGGLLGAQGTLFIPYTRNFGRDGGIMAVPVHGIRHLYVELGY